MTSRAPIIPYVSRTGTKTTLEALRGKGHWRLLVSATGVLRTEGFPYALENGAFTAYNQGIPFDETAFENALTLLGRDADFVVVPDIVGEGERSLAFSMEWLPRVLDATQVALIPVQNGIEPRHVESLIGPRVGIFVGGDDKARGGWKERTTPAWAALARRHGAWCHVGRVNTARRIAICTTAGATSFDGTSVAKFPKTLPLVDRAARQIGLALEES